MTLSRALLDDAIVDARKDFRSNRMDVFRSVPIMNQLGKSFALQPGCSKCLSASW
jgi:hypothetical protein